MKARLVPSVLLCLAAAVPAEAESIHWTHGRWFDGRAFVERSLYSVDGRLTGRKPARVDRTVDLAGRFVVPPFGDAHHHGISSAHELDAGIRRFLEDGIFYVKNPNVIPERLTPEVRSRLNHPRSIDVVFSNGGLTATGGHPVRVHAMLAARGALGDLEADDLEGRAYFQIDDTLELAAAWERIRAGRPDFIKTFVLFSEEFEKRRADETTGFKGLDPVVLAAIVRRAHADGLRVSTHVETAADFRRAVEAGTDEINHLPIPRAQFSPDLSAYRIDEATARQAAARGITVVATVSTLARMGGARMSAEQLAAARANQKANLATLVAAGVKVAIGSDGMSGESPMPTALSEALYLHEHGFFDAAALLRMWTEHTAATIFPQRRIGRLDPGYEASFLVLEGDPLADFANVRRIAMRVKQGEVLDLAPAQAAPAGTR